MAEELGRFLEGRPVLARAVGRSARLWRWGRRQPRLAGLAGGLVLVLAAGMAGVVWQWQRAEAARREGLEQLWRSCLAEGRATRWSRRAGQRFDSLAALAKAAAIRPSLELRNEAIAALALPDARVLRQWALSPGFGCDFDPSSNDTPALRRMAPSSCIVSATNASSCDFPGVVDPSPSGSDSARTADGWRRSGAARGPTSCGFGTWLRESSPCVRRRWQTT
ncbi:MAG: hypothetical protein M5U12_33545 [Verrucomicrobia bacterium]|nr:hypothetical protein [Verrucomicrobiota bacterium]